MRNVISILSIFFLLYLLSMFQITFLYSENFFVVLIYLFISSIHIHHIIFLFSFLSSLFRSLFTDIFIYFFIPRPVLLPFLRLLFLILHLFLRFPLLPSPSTPFLTRFCPFSSLCLSLFFFLLLFLLLFLLPFFLPFFSSFFHLSKMNREESNNQKGGEKNKETDSVKEKDKKK